MVVFGGAVPLDWALFWKTLCDSCGEMFQLQKGRTLILKNGKWPVMSSAQLYVRKWYEDQAEGFLKARDAALAAKSKGPDSTIMAFLYSGGSGLGKSTFLLFLMAHLVNEARSANAVIHFRYSKRAVDKSIVHYLLTSEGKICLYTEGQPVDYHFSDSVDVSEVGGVSKAVVVVTSEKSSEHERFDKVDVRSEFKFAPGVPVWEFDELKSIAPDSWTPDEVELRFAIFGGNPRHFLGFLRPSGPSEKFLFVEEMMSKEFERGVYNKVRWDAIVSYLVQRLSTVANQSDHDIASNSLRSMMWHTNNAKDFFWASQFMKLLGNHIKEQNESTLKNLLVQVVGQSGFGNCFEYHGHQRVAAGGKFLLRGLGRGNKSLTLDLPKLTRRRFHAAADIANLTDDQYGTPFIQNFPMIDSVIQPNILMQFTIAKNHPGGANMLTDFRKQLRENDPKMHALIFVVEDVGKFKYQEAFPNIKQYAMSYAEDQTTGELDPFVRDGIASKSKKRKRAEKDR